VATQEREEVAYRAIIRMILANQYRPGDYLLETELAQQLHLSRTPVCHALRRLVAEGFLEKRRKKGCFIPQPSAEDANQVFAARVFLESELAALAAEAATEQEREQLQQIATVQLADRDNRSKENYSLLNERFHFGIAQAAHNSYLERYSRNVFWRSNTYIFFLDSYYSRDDEETVHHVTPDQHVAITEAICGGDGPEARRLMAEHIETTHQKMFKPWEQSRN
jgi:DNA-binding GntR family transcriptional regulator